MTVIFPPEDVNREHPVGLQERADVQGPLDFVWASADHLTRLHQRLAAAAAKEGIVDVSYTTVETPVGLLLLAATEHGLVRVAFDREDHNEVLESLANKLGGRILRAPSVLVEASREISEYFAGTRRSFELPLDYSLSAGFRRQVQQLLPQIAYGHTQTYKDMALMAGNPKAVRAVGTACATNPLPIVIPCHRVLRSDGGLGGYLGGVEAKTALLELEGAV
ncbi:methylated-DNA--[protein]-cysteine S-methyltransferase [Pseudarthrobacter sp. J1738]|uniref:methylated-DNA--[protein]-cysteine S-methyltransferase n=1 Tax=unclassified Pseudarthrobacter TaxID=2647000 RepID=UPI003D2891F8